MENPTYQRIFNALNASLGHSSKSAAEDLELFTATPEATLNTLNTVRSIGTPQQFYVHKTSYLRGLMRSLIYSKSTWGQELAPKLIETADWLISLNEPTHHSTNYMRQIRMLLSTIQQKVSVPQEKVQEWTKAVACKKRSNYIPKFTVAAPCEFYGRNYKKPYIQNFNSDDRN